MARTERLFQLMQALRSLPSPVTAAQLAEETGVSPRTLYRDIETLRGLGAVIDGEAGYGYSLIEDAHLPPLGFEDDELEALVLGLREVGQVGDPHLAQAAQTALSKLKARLPDRQANRLEHAVLHARRFRPLPAPGVDPAILRTACWEERKIHIAYQDKEGRATARDVLPLGITLFDDSHCLLAWCNMRQGFRAFRLDRIEKLTVLDESFRPNRVRLLRQFKELIAQEAKNRASTELS